MEKSLNGTWKLINAATGSVIAAKVPGDITEDFYRAGEIPDPKFGMNYKKARYILENDYEYRLEFGAEKPQDNMRVFISFKGIDTFSEIKFNGTLLGKTQNMFLKYEYDVTDLLEKDNVLCVKMFSVLNRMKTIDAEGYFGCFNKERIFIRKEQCCFGWDWAPDLPGYGIWDDVVLSYRPECRIEDIRVKTDLSGNATFFAELSYNVRTDEYKRFADTDILRYTLERTPNAGEKDAVAAEFSVGGAKNFGTLKIENAELWYPVGYGVPALYAYKVELLRNGKVLDCKTGKLGFRTTELIEEPIGGDRMSFRLFINGKDVFVKGSNWVPCECFTGETREEKYRELISMAKNAGINMLRVWGGGIYEKDIFYRLCDEQGIMVWQDFMFACADIPETDADFVHNVEEECVYQVKRLRNHPSLVYWCGGNEKTGSCGLLKRYGDHLVDVIIRGIVGHYDGTRPYVRQSPYSLTDVGNDFESGETHGTSFDIIHLEDYNDFLRTAFNRKVSFVSECAVMGSCVPETYRKFVPENELWPLGEIYEDRFCDNPYGDLMSFVKRQEKAVALMFGEARGIDEFAVKSMAVQAEVLKTEVVNMRKNRAVCGGIMNWMFSDVWYTGTWSIIDYDCKPKIAYYALKRAYAPIIAEVIPDGDGNYFLYVINDNAEKISVEIACECGTLRGEYDKKQVYRLIAGGYESKLLGRITPSGDFVRVVLTINGEDRENRESYESVTFFKPFKELSFASDYTTEQKIVETRGELCDVEIEITAKNYARLVHLVVPEGCAVDNDWFDVTPESSARVKISNVPVKEVRNIKITDYAAYVSEEKRQ